MKIYSPSGLVVGSTRQYDEVHPRSTLFAVCIRCEGTGARSYDVAPWVPPVAKTAPGLVHAEVDVTCDHCGGSGLARVLGGHHSSGDRG